MTLRVSKAELQATVTNHLVKHPAFRLLRGMTQDNLNTVVAMVLQARATAIEEIKAKQGQESVKLGEPVRSLKGSDDITQRWYPRD